MSISSVQDNIRIRLDWTAFASLSSLWLGFRIQLDFLSRPKILPDISFLYSSGEEIPLLFPLSPYVPSWPAPANPLRNPAAPRFRWFRYCPAVDDSRRERTSGWWITSVIGWCLLHQVIQCGGWILARKVYCLVTCPIVKREHFLDVILGQFCGSLDSTQNADRRRMGNKGKVSKLIYQRQAQPRATEGSGGGGIM